MTLAIATDWCFDWIDISSWIKPAAGPPQQEAVKDEPAPSGRLTAALALDIIFQELHHEADRSVRDRLNEALRQWHWRNHPKTPA